MARQTKQERLVNSMFENVSEHLHELRSLASNPATKEFDVERWCQSFLRSCLGYSATNGYAIRAQEMKGRMRPDLVLLKGDKPFCVVEVKKLGYDLNKSDFRSGKVQLGEYLHSLGNVSWGVLCNGYEWRLYDFSNPSVGGIEILSFDIRNDAEEIELGKRAIEDICWEFFDFHEATFSEGEWTEFSKEATAFSPESLAKAILSADIIRHLAKVIRGEHEYKANTEVLVDKVSELLEKGLNDFISGWNETKQAELYKYIKSQKRIGRRRKRTRVTEETMAGPNIVDSAAGPGEGSTEDVSNSFKPKVPDSA
jgi:hypothetical protein